MTFSRARARLCVDDPLFLHARTYAKTKPATFFAVLKSKTFNRIQSYATIYLSESLNVAPREHVCTTGFFCDKLFRSISYVTIFSLVETTTTSRADIYKCEHPRNAKRLHLNITVCAATGAAVIVARNLVPACIRMRSNIGRTYLRI